MLIKIGGSLTYHAEKLLNELKKIEKPIIIIPGGGEFANVVRKLYEKTNLNDRGAHKLATLCVDLMGMYFSEISCIETTDNLFDAKRILEKNGKVIFLPSKLVLSTDELPHSWDVTSDTIALYVAKFLNLKEIIVATDVDGVYDKYPGGKLLNTISAKDIRGFTSVDKHLPQLLIKYKMNCYVVNGKHPERIINLLNGKMSICTKITWF
ncbi:[5-(aminomethyl)furan-3-yl]methyl phosphate kinase [Methanotorris formicicus]|uniref:Aspartate/glutamate/uridylate kinase n=1 Tax=Methanotorris formicicus Mc-S-70 TaxID=647171 RepID=H1KXU3_9EURY|nr:[5-(aminomethyl)furan-3-yl]methyl phosphate kinase [Methanotorris formicicus]EHP87727.1 aspartate/glutamate/uridylate kinase [Methanotorris formicicus Mc-S-70]